jgi:hypothetical protein
MDGRRCGGGIVTAVRNLLDRWRTVTRGTAASCEVLARGNGAFHVEGLAAQPLTLARCAEQLADAMTADVCDEYERTRMLPPTSAEAAQIVAALEECIRGCRQPSPDWNAALFAVRELERFIGELAAPLVIGADVEPIEPRDGAS